MKCCKVYSGTFWFLWSEGGHHGTKDPKEMSKGTDATGVKVSAPGGLRWDAPAGRCQCGGLVQLPWPGTGGQQVSLQRACQGQPLASTLGSCKEQWGQVSLDASSLPNPRPFAQALCYSRHFPCNLLAWLWRVDAA